MLEGRSLCCKPISCILRGVTGGRRENLTNIRGSIAKTRGASTRGITGEMKYNPHIRDGYATQEEGKPQERRDSLNERRDSIYVWLQGRRGITYTRERIAKTRGRRAKPGGRIAKTRGSKLKQGKANPKRGKAYPKRRKA